MNDANHGESELARLIVESLNLEGVEPQALDSLDMLELSMAIEQKYGVKLRSDDPDNEKNFASLRSLARHIHQQRAR
jgi:acyl carrier protein